MAEELIGGFTSPYLRRGLWNFKGYGLYATTERIFGVKGEWKNIYRIFAQTGQGMGARLTIEQLEQRKDFEVSKKEVQEVNIQQTRGRSKWLTWRWANIAIRTTKDVYKIGIIRGFPEDFNLLKNMFTAFDVGKFVFNIDDKHLG